MGWIGSLLGGMGLWLLKALLGGIFGKMNAELEAEAAHSAEAGKIHAEATVEASNTEVEILKAQQATEEKWDKLKPSDEDPFNSGEWNK